MRRQNGRSTRWQGDLSDVLVAIQAMAEELAQEHVIRSDCRSRAWKATCGSTGCASDRGHRRARRKARGTSKKYTEYAGRWHQARKWKWEMDAKSSSRAQARNPPVPP